MTRQDATRRLVITWAALMALSLALAAAASVWSAARLGPVWLVAIGAVAALKSRLILGEYLMLRVAPGALRGFTAAVAFTVVVVIGAFIAVRI